MVWSAGSSLSVTYSPPAAFFSPSSCATSKARWPWRKYNLMTGRLHSQMNAARGYWGALGNDDRTGCYPFATQLRGTGRGTAGRKAPSPPGWGGQFGGGAGSHNT